MGRNQELLDFLDVRLQRLRIISTLIACTLLYRQCPDADLRANVMNEHDRKTTSSFHQLSSTLVIETFVFDAALEDGRATIICTPKILLPFFLERWRSFRDVPAP
jgi:hypothetical protein